MTSPQNRNDSELLRLLRDALTESDPVPQEVTDYALAVFGWPRLEAEVAELVFDSFEEAPAATRAGAPIRMLQFELRHYVVDMEYDRDAALLFGTVQPDARYRIELIGRASPIEADSDDFGRFEMGLSGSGPISVVVGTDSGSILRTDWFLIA